MNDFDFICISREYISKTNRLNDFSTFDINLEHSSSHLILVMRSKQSNLDSNKKHKHEMS